MPCCCKTPAMVTGIVAVACQKEVTAAAIGPFIRPAANAGLGWPVCTLQLPELARELKVQWPLASRGDDSLMSLVVNTKRYSQPANFPRRMFVCDGAGLLSCTKRLPAALASTRPMSLVIPLSLLFCPPSSRLRPCSHPKQMDVVCLPGLAPWKLYK